MAVTKAHSPDIPTDFEALARQHLSDLLGSALRMTRNWEDAQDLTQDTLVRAFRGFESFQPGTNFKAWVFRIMVNTYINLRRRDARRPRTTSWEDMPGESESGGFDPLAEEGQPEATTLAVLPNEHLKAALDALPNEFRIPVLLCDVEEQSYKDIARMLGIPLGTVRSRIFRGRQRLREALLRARQGVGDGLGAGEPVADPSDSGRGDAGAKR